MDVKDVRKMVRQDFFFESSSGQGIIYLDRRIEKALASRIARSITSLQVNNAKEITFHIDSSGGELGSAFRICDAIRTAGIPINGLVIGEAYSCACIILQACRVRSAFAHAQLSIHDINHHFSCDLTVDSDPMIMSTNLRKAFSGLRKKQEEIDQIFHQKTGLSLGEVRELSRVAKVLDAQEAKKLGLIDEIV